MKCGYCINICELLSPQAAMAAALHSGWDLAKLSEDNFGHGLHMDAQWTFNPIKFRYQNW